MASLKKELKAQIPTAKDDIKKEIVRLEEVVTSCEKKYGTQLILSYVFCFLILPMLFWPMIFGNLKKVEQLRKRLAELKSQVSTVKVINARTYVSFSKK